MGTSKQLAQVQRGFSAEEPTIKTVGITFLLRNSIFTGRVPSVPTR